MRTPHTRYAREVLIPLVLSGEINKMEAARMLSEKSGKPVEISRGYIRQLTGANGKGKTTIKPIQVMKSNIAEGLSRIKKQELPEKKELNLTGCKALILSDVHIPHHSPEAVEAALQFGVDEGADTIILNGDIVDFYQISRWEREPLMMGIEEELIGLQKLFALLRELFPKARVIYREGNHEERLRAYVLKNAKEFAMLDMLKFPQLIGADKYNIQILNKRDILKLGKLNVLHGHEFGESVFSPVNPARGLFLRAKASAIIGHHHQSSHHAEGNINGDRVGCWSLGCLCDLDPPYRPYAYTKWNHGFAFVKVAKDGAFYVDNKQIISGRIV